MAAAQAAPAPPTSMEVENEAPACEGTRGWEEEIRAERDRLREQQKAYTEAIVELRRLRKQERRLRVQSEALLGRILQLDDSRAEDSWSSEGLLDDDTESEQEEVFSEPTPQKDFRGHAFPILVHNTGAAQLKVYSLGRIVHDRDAFHTPKHIWPVGYVCTRRHFSMRNPQRTVTYTCEILDGGDMPSFRITASDDLDNPIIASSSSAAWKAVLVEVNRKKYGIESRSNPPGPDVFGLNDPVVRALILKLPDAEKCRKYGRKSARRRSGKADDGE